MTEGKVIVMADITGAVVGMSNNSPEYGYIRVEQIGSKISNGGWFNFVKKSALIKGTLEDLRTADFKEGDILPGKIVIKESLVPFYSEDPDKHLKRAGNNGIPCTLDGQPIYRECIYTTNINEEDELIEHDNGEDIKFDIKRQKEEVTLDCSSNLLGLRALTPR